ncbi:hypothetical protein CYMTET_19371 [Cymbomonas tetramitiformis]|uniref:Uncharacterized protein n=1 Tax=Cymbomonas tetramitiformis TaxID=36881 RepID=A0AAE0L4Y4_9CHLO|nr:hypothetical protein CYMTET_19371 [Cymbomonas tetramitiformis]
MPEWFASLRSRGGLLACTNLGELAEVSQAQACRGPPDRLPPEPEPEPPPPPPSPRLEQRARVAEERSAVAAQSAMEERRMREAVERLEEALPVLRNTTEAQQTEVCQGEKRAQAAEARAAEVDTQVVTRARAAEERAREAEKRAQAAEPRAAEERAREAEKWAQAAEPRAAEERACEAEKRTQVAEPRATEERARKAGTQAAEPRAAEERAREAGAEPRAAEERAQANKRTQAAEPRAAEERAREAEKWAKVAEPRAAEERARKAEKRTQAAEPRAAEERAVPSCGRKAQGDGRGRVLARPIVVPGAGGLREQGGHPTSAAGSLGSLRPGLIRAVQAVRPDVVMLNVPARRTQILSYDKDMPWRLLEEATTQPILGAAVGRCTEVAVRSTREQPLPPVLQKLRLPVVALLGMGWAHVASMRPFLSARNNCLGDMGSPRPAKGRALLQGCSEAGLRCARRGHSG